MNELLELDRMLHASVSANLSIGITTLLVKFGIPPPYAIAVGHGGALLIGYFKEFVLDSRPDMWDLAANAIGTQVGSATVALALSFNANF